MNPDEEAVDALAGILGGSADEDPVETPDTSAETEEVEQEETEPTEVEETEDEDVEPSQIEQEEPDTSINWLDYLPQAAPQVPLTPDENGQVDLQALINHTVNNRLQAQTAEVRGWQEANKVLPGIASDPQLRDAVHKLRIADVAGGGQGNLAAAAKSLKAILGDTASKAKAGARASVRIQKAAAIESGGSRKQATSGKGNDLMTRAQTGDSAAIEQLIAGWIDSGKI